MNNKVIFYLVGAALIGFLIGYSVIASKYIWLREIQIEQYQTLTECQHSEKGYFEYWERCKDVCK